MDEQDDEVEKGGNDLEANKTNGGCDMDDMVAQNATEVDKDASKENGSCPKVILLDYTDEHDGESKQVIMGDANINCPTESRSAKPKDLENSNISHGLDSGGLLMAEAMESLQRNVETQNEEARDLMDMGLEGLQKEVEVNHALSKLQLKELKGKARGKTSMILGYSKVEIGGNIKGRRNKNKCVVLRSAVASAALSASLPSEGINNRNQILLDEAKAIWEVDKLFGIHYDGDEEEVVNKIADMEALNKARVDCQH